MPLNFPRQKKGETLVDSIRVCSEYCDVIVLRHNISGAAKTAATVASVPLINAGDGNNEHPTQALLDLFTIWEHCRKNNKTNPHILLSGDLRNSRTIHSLIRLCGQVNTMQALGLQPTVSTAAPANRTLPEPLRTLLHAPTAYLALEPTDLSDVDVLYFTRPQIERGLDTLPQGSILTVDLAGFLPSDSVILHPLPRTAELPEAVDALPQAHYFEQAKNGLFIRMALLIMLLRPETVHMILSNKKLLP